MADERILRLQYSRQSDSYRRIVMILAISYSVLKASCTSHVGVLPTSDAGYFAECALARQPISMRATTFNQPRYSVEEICEEVSTITPT